MILIAGAGLAGLSAAFHLGDRDYRIIERDDRPGGLCRTEKIGSYDFDYGGHLLHLKGDDVRGLVLDLLGERLTLYKRKSAIFSKGVFTPYPFQVNTHGLPPEVIRDCLLGFMEAMIDNASEYGSAPDNFFEWIYHAFGQGFAKHFFLPFNEKFFKTDLSELTTEWASWSIPRPTPRDVVNGALGIEEGEFGYNVEFYYPKGGIEELPLSLCRGLKRPVETGVGLAEVIPDERRAVLSTGEEVSYERLISTLPLDRLLGMLRGAPDEIEEAALRLNVLSVLCVNLGVKGPPVSDQHWIYIPEPEYTFHRIGVYSNFMDLPPDKNSLYLEVTLPGPVEDSSSAGVDEMVERVRSEFKGTPLWNEGGHEIEVMEAFLIEHGYVVYDGYRRDHLPGIMSYLAEHGIESVGRYGRWEYSAMEDAIRQGIETAKDIIK